MIRAILLAVLPLAGCAAQTPVVDDTPPQSPQVTVSGSVSVGVSGRL